MKKLAMLSLLLVGMLGTNGCDTPAYSTQERFQAIGRNWVFEYEQIQDDVDHFFLLRTATHLSEWNIQ